MKYLPTLLFVLFVGTFVSAQEVPDRLLHKEKSDPEAKKILDKTKALYESFKTMVADFTLTIEVPLEDKVVQKGKIKQAGEKFSLELPELKIYSDGKTVYTHMVKNKQVQITDAEDMEDSDEFLTPQDFLKMYEEDQFYYVLMNEAYEGKMPIQQIEFKPKDRDSEYSKMRVTINKKNAQMVRIKVFSKDGTRFTLAIDNLKANTNIPASAFKLDTKSLPGDVSVEDLRI